VFDAWLAEGKRRLSNHREKSLKCSTETMTLRPFGAEADDGIPLFPQKTPRRKRVSFMPFDYLPTLPYCGIVYGYLAKDLLLGEMGMLGYVKEVQRKEIRQGLACVKQSRYVLGSNMGDESQRVIFWSTRLKRQAKKYNESICRSD